MVRSSRMLRSRLGFRVAERAHHIFFKSRSDAVVRNGGAGRKAPRIVGELLCGSRWHQPVCRDCAGQGSAAAQKGAAMKPTIAGNRRQAFLFSFCLVTWGPIVLPAGLVARVGD